MAYMDDVAVPESSQNNGQLFSMETGQISPGVRNSEPPHSSSASLLQITVRQQTLFLYLLVCSMRFHTHLQRLRKDLPSQPFRIHLDLVASRENTRSSVGQVICLSIREPRRTLDDRLNPGVLAMCCELH